MSSYDCKPGPVSQRLNDEPLLRAECIDKVYTMNDGSALKVLENFNLELENIRDKPQIASILGPSGCGKTTALRILSGLEKPTAGQVLLSNGLDGQGYEMKPVKSGTVGVVFQSYPLFEDRRVLNNLVHPAVKRGMTKADATEKAKGFLEAFGLYNHREAWPSQLSGGQRQRVAILQQLMIEGRHFLIMDEPFSGLDSVNIQSVINLILSTAYLNTLNTFIIITHDITSALIVSDEIYLLGREKDESGKPISGGRVMYYYDLIGEGLAYHPDIEDKPRFSEIRRTIRHELMPKL